MPFALRPAAPVTAVRHAAPATLVSRSTPRRSVAARAAKPRFFVGGNWKANGSRDLVETLSAGLADCRVGGNGAFTGDVTADMLSDAGVPWVIVGHSERRTLHGETDQEVESKIRYAMSKGLAVIACIGETLEEREGGRLEEVLARQLAAVVRGVGGGERWARAVIAYEPVWAIGTGKVASPEQAQETHAFLRETLAKQLAELDAPATLASTVRIIYGGSVNAGNAATLAALQDVDGFLVGGASLKADSFIDIVVAGASQN